MYHSISREQQDTSLAYFETNTFPSVFEEHMQYLASHGYKTVGLDCFHNITDPNQKSVVITFDDGYLDFYENAFPILKKYGATATMFLPTSFIRDSRKEFKQRPCLTWQEVRELSENGITFGSHSHTHSKLDELSSEDLEKELRKSKEEIQNRLGLPVDSFCYPFAFPETKKYFVQQLKNTLTRLGYRTCFTTRIGLNPPEADPLILKRIPINSHDDSALFQAKLQGAYDWLCPMQTIYKKSKELVFCRWRLLAYD